MSSLTLLTLLGSVSLWIPVALGELVFILIGWLVVPVAALAGAYSIQDNKYYPGPKLLWNSPLMAPYQNYEDGIDGGKDYYQAKTTFGQILYWYNRNPANGTRWLSPFNCQVDKTQVKYVGSLDSIWQYDIDDRDQWFFAWQGFKAGFYWIKTWPLLGKRRLFIGYAIYPSDTQLGQYGYRLYGAGFKMQFKTLEP